jgi:hypothetical protein
MQATPRDRLARSASRRRRRPERIAPAAAQFLRQVPLGAAAGEREAEHSVAGEVIIKPGREAGGAERGAAEPAPRMQDVVAPGHITTRRQDGLHRTAYQGCATGNVGEARGRRTDLHEVDRAGLESEITGDGHLTTGRAGAGRERAAAVDLRVARRSGVAERSAIHFGEA